MGEHGQPRHLGWQIEAERIRSPMGRVERTREIARRRQRRAKLQKLRERFNKASNKSEKQAILEKVQRISPLVDLESEPSGA